MYKYEILDNPYSYSRTGYWRLKRFDNTVENVQNYDFWRLSGKPVVQDVIPDIAIKMFNKCIFLTRQDAKEVLFIKMNKELSLTTY